MYDMEAFNGPKQSSVITRAGQVPVQSNKEFIDFIQQMAMRRQHPQPSVGAGVHPAPSAQRQAVQRMDTGENNLQRQEESLRLAQINDAKMKLNEDALTRNMHKTAINMGPYGTAYDFDSRVMTPGQQAAVSPQNSQFSAAGAQDDAIRGQGGDADWAQFLRTVQLRRQLGSQGGF